MQINRTTKRYNKDNMIPQVEFREGRVYENLPYPYLLKAERLLLKDPRASAQVQQI